VRIKKQSLETNQEDFGLVSVKSSSRNSILDTNRRIIKAAKRFEIIFVL
jgi:hypothetical protein